MKNIHKKTIVQTIFILVLFLAFSRVDAYSITAQKVLQINCANDCPDEGMILVSYDGKITTNLTKKIYLRRANGRDTGLYFEIEKGESVTLDEEDTTATWFETGAFYDSPPADGQWYRQLSGYKDDYYHEIYMVVSKPKDTKVAQISSLDPDIMSCNNSTKKCTALKPGTAFIMVDFPIGNQSSTKNWSGENKILGNNPYGYGLISYKVRKYHWLDMNDNKKYDSGNVMENYTYTVRDGYVANTSGNIKIASHTYSFYSAIYMVTVTQAANLPHTTTLNPVTSITQSGATINWSYSDPENDSQTNYQILVATSSTFAASSIVKNLTKTTTNVSSVRSLNISQGLKASTLYYVKMRTYNENNGWSAYSSTRSFTTLANPLPIPTNVSAVCSPTGDQITVSWNDAPGYDAVYFRAEDRTLYPLTDSQLLWDNNVTLNSKTINVTPGDLYEWWIHTKDGTNYSSAVGGELTCTGGTCPADATLTGGLCVCNDSSKEFNSSQNACLDRCSMNATWYNNTCNCNNGATDYSSCTTCPSGLQLINGTCTDPNSDKARVSVFDFSPDIAGTNGTCPLILTVENTLGCRLVDRFNQSQTIATTSDYIIDINTISKSVGTYRLYCTGTNNSEDLAGSKACYSNSDVKEN